MRVTRAARMLSSKPSFGELLGRVFSLPSTLFRGDLTSLITVLRSVHLFSEISYSFDGCAATAGPGRFQLMSANPLVFPPVRCRSVDPSACDCDFRHSNQGFIGPVSHHSHSILGITKQKAENDSLAACRGQ